MGDLGAIPPLSGPNLTVAHAAMSAACLVVMVGVVFLARPSRAVLVWCVGYMTAAVSSFASVTAFAIDSEVLRRAAMGLTLAVPFLLWSGLRIRFDRRGHPWAAAVIAVVAAAALVLSGTGAFYSPTFRLVFFLSSLAGAAAAWEVWRSGEGRNPMLYPLVVVSLSITIIGVATLGSGLLLPGSGGDDFSTVRSMNQVGVIIYLLAATVSLFAWTLAETRAGGEKESREARFTATARERLERAEELQESLWAVVVFRLDDIEDLQRAGGQTAVSRTVAAAEAEIRASFPAEADIGRDAAGRVTVVLSRPSSAIRECIRTALRRIAENDTSAGVTVRVSASAGWVPVDVVGYDFTRLRQAALAAADQAATAGGDRWQRVSANG